MERNNRLWELLGKKTAEEISDQEEKELERLLKENEGNVQYMMSVLDHYWDTVQNAKEPERLTKPAGHRHSASRNTSPGAYRIAAFKRHYKRRRLLLSVLLAVVIASGGWLTWKNFVIKDHEMNVVSTRNGSKTMITLPDGTQVWLNADSKITYPNNFQQAGSREITLAGEAFFDVKHDAGRPFIIHTRYLNIKDIGTSFNIKAYPDDSLSEASLISGAIEVSLRSEPGKSLILSPKEKMVYYIPENNMSLKTKENTSEAECLEPLEKSSHLSQMKIAHVTDMIGPSGDSIITEIAWVHNQFVFDGEKFSQLAKRMERWYNVTFEINSTRIAGYSFTGIFEGETLEQALKELQMIRPFHFTISKDKVLITD